MYCVYIYILYTYLACEWPFRFANRSQMVTVMVIVTCLEDLPGLMSRLSLNETTASNCYVHNLLGPAWISQTSLGPNMWLERYHCGDLLAFEEACAVVVVFFPIAHICSQYHYHHHHDHHNHHDHHHLQSFATKLIFPIESMYGIFTYMKTKKNNHSCGLIYQSHGWYGFISSLILQGRLVVENETFFGEEAPSRIPPTRDD